jgi:transcriptional regulator with XRE-family HTH domain
VPQSYISEIETGKKPGSIDAWRRLAAALDVTIDDLLGE